MESDAEGFSFPVIDASRCIECGACMRVCPAVSRDHALNRPLSCSAAYNRDDEVRRKSSSGGAFSALAETIIEQGGSVFGAQFIDPFTVRHICAHTKEELQPLLRSKYLQSDMTGVYRELRNELKNGKPVLFAGLPCHAQAVRRFLGNPDNLILAETLCHGVPSPGIFLDHVKELEKRYASKIEEYAFHTKRIDWRSNTIYIRFKDGTECDQNSFSNPFLFGFFNNLILRSSCYDCIMRTEKRASDIILADFWEIRQIDPSCEDARGVSMVMACSQKGEKLLSDARGHLAVKPVSLEQTIAVTKNIHPRAYSRDGRSACMRAYTSGGYAAIKKPYLSPPAYKVPLKKIKDIAMRFIRSRQKQWEEK